MSVDERIAALTQKMLRRKLYAVISAASPTPEKLKALLPAHLEYMIALEKRGVLVRVRAIGRRRVGRRPAPA